MITDARLQVATNQEVASVSEVSASSINLSAVRDIGMGGELLAWVICTAAGTPGSGAMNIQAIVASNAALTSDVEVLGNSQNLNDEEYTAGMHPIFIKLNTDTGGIMGMYADTQIYLGLNFVVAVAMPSGYTFSGGFCLQPTEGRRFYASGYTF